jgi:hypothetical protein
VGKKKHLPVTVCKNSVKLLLGTKKLSPERCEMIMTEKMDEIDIKIEEKIPEATPYAGALPFMQMCQGLDLPDIINNNLNVRGLKGYKDSDHILMKKLSDVRQFGACNTVR